MDPQFAQFLAECGVSRTAYTEMDLTRKLIIVEHFDNWELTGVNK